MTFDVFSNDKQWKAVIYFNVGSFNHFCTGYELHDFTITFYEKDGTWGSYSKTSNEPDWFFALTKKKLLKELKQSQGSRTLVAFYRSDFEVNAGGDYTERGRMLEAMLSDIGNSHIMANKNVHGQMSIMSLNRGAVDKAYTTLKVKDPTSQPEKKKVEHNHLTREAVLAFMEEL